MRPIAPASWLFIIAVLLTAAPAWACDLSPGSRPESPTAFTNLVKACLAQPPSPVRFDADDEAEFFAAINEARVAEGRVPIEWREELRAPARFHSLDQSWNGIFGHRGADGRLAADRIAAMDRTLVRESARENVAQGSGDYDPEKLPAILQYGLMDSPGHRDNILAPEITHGAVGVTWERDRLVVTQIFVAKVGEVVPAVPLQATPEKLKSLIIKLDFWTVGGLALSQGEAEPVDITPDSEWPAAPMQLYVRGEQRLPDVNGYRYTYFPTALVDFSPDGASYK